MRSARNLAIRRSYDSSFVSESHGDSELGRRAESGRWHRSFRRIALIDGVLTASVGLVEEIDEPRVTVTRQQRSLTRHFGWWRYLLLLGGGLLLATTSLVVGPQVASATTSVTLYVNTSGTATSGCTTPGTGACETIQEGVTAAESYTDTDVTIEVAAGTYDENDTVNANVNLEGAGAITTILDGTDSGTVIALGSSYTVGISGFTIENGTGAGIANGYGGTVTATNDILADNSGGAGGGILDYGGTVTATNDTFSRNSTSTAGGGIYENGGGTVTATNDTFVDNSGSGGGGIWAQGGTARVTNDTFLGNSADNYGGGIEVGDGGTMTATDDTLSGNISYDGDGGGVGNFVSSGTLMLANTVLADNSGGNCGGTITNQGYNISYPSTDTSCPGTLLNGNPLLGSLQNNGGPTETMAITPASSAFEVVPAANCSVSTDQRGDPRPGVPNQNCDAGAFEYQTATGSISGTVTDAITGHDLSGICVNAGENNASPESAVTDGSGNYTISDLPAGSYYVEFYVGAGCGNSGNYAQQWWDDASTLSAATVVSVGTGEVPDIDAAMVEGGSISGTVTDATTGDDLSGICVIANTPFWDGLAKPWTWNATTADNGTYTISNLDPSLTYDIQFTMGCGVINVYAEQWYNGTLEGAVSQTGATALSVTAGEITQPIDAAMVESGSISGTVTDATTGDDLSGICVNAVTPPGQPGVNGNMSTTTAADGTYTITGVPAGSYIVEFSDSAWCGNGGNYANQWWKNSPSESGATEVYLTAGWAQLGIDAAMVEGGSISGTVTDATTGDDLSGICVNAVAAGSGSLGWSSSTAADGTYTISGLDPSLTYDIQFSVNAICGNGGDYAGQWYNGTPTGAIYQNGATPVSVTAGGITESIDAAMAEGGSISGTVTDTSGNDLSDICVSVTAFPFGLGYSESTFTAGDGSYTITALPAASNYIVQFSNGCGNNGNYATQWWEGSSSPSPSPTMVSVTAGGITGSIDASMAPGGSISGTVLDVTDGLPLGGICVSATNASGGSASNWSATTAVNGTYAITGLPATPSGDLLDVEFSSCGADAYATQFWNDTLTATASLPDPGMVSLTVGGSQTPIDADMVPTSPEPPPSCATGSTGCQHGIPFGGTATAVYDNTTGTAYGTVGTITVSGYASDPVGSPPPGSTGVYMDVNLSSPNNFTKVTVDDCDDVNTGTELYWWNGSAWQAVAGDPGPNYSSGPPACVSVTLDSSTSPTLSHLTGTVFGVVSSSSSGGGGGGGGATAPGAPTGLTATAGNTKVALSWTIPSSNGGSAITGYDVYEGTTSGGESSTPVNTSLISGTSYTVSGLTNGTKYYFTVKALNAVGSSAASNEASATPAAGVPVQRIYGTDAIETSIAVSQAEFPTSDSAKAVVLARSDFFSDALAGGPLAAKVGGPLLITPGASLSSSLDPRIQAEIQRVLPVGGTVYILGGDLALSPSIDTALQALGYVAQRVAGTDEYATAVDVAEQLGNPSVIFEATGLTFPDALSAVPAAIEKGGAILLTDGSTQAPETAAYLAAHPGDTRYAIGGPLAAYGADPTATPVYGQDLYDTSATVATTFFPEATVFGAATGANYPDALSGGVFMGTSATAGPVLLVQPSGPLPTSIASYLSGAVSTLTQGYLFGGPLAVGNDVLSELQSTG
jgi:hypothetical protein